MRMLKFAVIAMGVLIVAGLGILIAVIATRGFGAAAIATPPTVLDEPAGTHIAAIATLPDRLAVQLQGGGPDRVVIIDLRTGRLVGRTSLAR